ncbi:MAG: zf-TFIIB domain-containing protein [Phycisphaerae bacterium]
MKCPRCNNLDLAISNRQGVEIDYCPSCRGVWLDRGELDKIIARSSEFDDDHAGLHSRPHSHSHPRKRGMWRDLFEFD